MTQVSMGVLYAGVLYLASNAIRPLVAFHATEGKQFRSYSVTKLLILVLLVGMYPVVSAEAASDTPRNTNFFKVRHPSAEEPDSER